MAMMTGEVTVTCGKDEYTLHLTMRGVAKLQAEFGNDFVKDLQVADDALPPLALCLRVVEVALERCHRDADIATVADDILTSDLGVIRRLFEATFPPGDVSDDPAAEDEGAGKK